MIIPGLSITSLPGDTRAGRNFTHKVTVDYRYLDDFAATSRIQRVLPYSADNSKTVEGPLVLVGAAYDLETNFNGGATTNLTIKIGSTVNDDSLLAATSIHEDATEVVAAATSNALDTAPEVLTAAGAVLLTFTATGANLSELTSGKIHIYLNVISLRDLRGIDGYIE